MKAPIIVIAPLLALALFVPNVGRTQGPVSNGHVQGAERSWKTVEELSPEELRNVDLRSETPRDPRYPIFPPSRILLLHHIQLKRWDTG